jgi:Mg-chelatase subunit ChlD
MMAAVTIRLRTAACLVLAASSTAWSGDTPSAPPLSPAVECLGKWLEHQDWTVRSLASFELRKRSEAGAIGAAMKVLGKEKEPRVLSPLLSALQPRARVELMVEGDAALVDLLFRLVDHDNRRVRARARAVLRSIAPHDAKGLEGIRAWWKDGRKAFEQERAEMVRRSAKFVPLGSTPLAPGESATVCPDPAPFEYLEGLTREGLELCIVLDATGSMAPVIAAAKSQAIRLVRRLSSYVPRVRTGLVTYDDGASTRLPLTHEESGLLRVLNKIAASGGGDIEEGVDKGLRMALRQERMGWSRAGWRVLIVIGDAPPHEEDVASMLAFLKKARTDEDYDHPVVVHTVSTDPGGVPHFEAIAKAGGGWAVTLHDSGRLVEELVALTFGSGFLDRVRPWLAEVDATLDETEP